ncbi:hypothetical protein T484DRAFT_1943020 [Baffinella frigidus]|nr:hypothetical protein T484DRAFT_1943020 [Cryptophyta sp. CCMP2293]
MVPSCVPPSLALGSSFDGVPPSRQTSPDGAGAGAGVGSSSSGGARPPGWIDPDLLEVKSKACICALCKGLLVKPTSGCRRGCSFCRICYRGHLLQRKDCPTCSSPVADEKNLVHNRPLEDMIAELNMRCSKDAMENGEDEAAEAGPPAAKRAKAVTMTSEALRKELGERGLGTGGERAELVTRLNKDRKTGGGGLGEEEEGCPWKGQVGQLEAHRRKCGWVPVKCPNEGCTESPCRKDLPEHTSRCGTCRHCNTQMRGSLAEHEARCPYAEIECPNESKGCRVRHERGSMNIHLEECKHQEVACRVQGCDARFPRKDERSHLNTRHPPSTELAMSLLGRIAALEGRVAAAESEQCHAAASPTSWVFNWKADGWGMGRFQSETRDFGAGVTGWCVLKVASPDLEDSHFLGYYIQGNPGSTFKCRTHVTFSILDKHDATLRTVFEVGSLEEPAAEEFKGMAFAGWGFTPTEGEKAQSVRADGSVVLRAEMRLFLH